MKKSLLLLFSAIITAGYCQAEQLTPEQALARVRTAAGPQSRAVDMTRMSNLVYTAKTDDNADLYIFNASAGDGYMIVSADDCAAPLLGYTDKGDFDPRNMPDNLKAWIEGYQRQIAWASARGIRYEAGSSSSRAEVAPLLKTKWDQGAPYNNKCPLVGSTRTYTGCVATAMAQVMKYHEWPTRGTGSHSYTWTTENGEKKTLSASFNTAYDWANMLDEYTSTSTTAQNDAVAKLMYNCGVSVDMGYGTGASGALSSKIPGALSTYFGYDKGMAYLQRDCYGINQWEEIIYNELAAKRPVLYDGISNLGQDNQVGHEFVCDGYRDGYYHINWGWSGMSDGYFKLTALDPGSQGTGGGASGFNYGQGAIVGIKKAEEGSKAPIMFYMGENWEVTPETSSRNTNTALTFTGFYNYSTETYNVVYGLKLVNASGNASYIKSNNYKNSMEAGYGYSTYEINSNQITVTGSYKVYPAVYIEDTKTWHDVLMPIYNTPYLNLTATPATLSFSEPDIASDFTISDMKLETPLFYNTTFTITANVENRGREYYDFISAALLRTGTNNVLAQSESMLLDVPANETMKLNYTSKFTDKLMAGTYDLVLLSSDGEIISARLPVEYSTASTEITINDFKLANENANSVPMNDIRFTGSLTCKSGFFNNVLTVALFASGSNSSVAAFNTDPITAKAGETVTFTATGSFLNGTVGSTYLAYLFQNSTQLTRTKVSFTLAKPLGIEDITDDGGCTLYPNPAVDNVTISADSPITSVELFTFNGSQAMKQAVNGSSTSIDLNVSSLPQGIYIVRIVTGNKTITKRLIKQ